MNLIILLIILGTFYAAGWKYTGHPWETVLWIWLIGWPVGALPYFLWTLFRNPVFTWDKRPIRERFAGAAFFSLFKTSAWPVLIANQSDKWIDDLAVRLGLRAAPRPPNESLQKQDKKEVEDSENNWQLEGESDLAAITIPASPTTGTPTLVRLTHSNSYGPFTEVDFYVRIGDPEKPTADDDLDGATDWTKAELVEELVSTDEGKFFRSEVPDNINGETPWSGTFEAQLAIPPGRRSIEIKIVSQKPKLMRSAVLSDWVVEVGRG